MEARSSGNVCFRFTCVLFLILLAFNKKAVMALEFPELWENLEPQSDLTSQEQEVVGLLKRVLPSPDIASQFQIKLVSIPDTKTNLDDNLHHQDRVYLETSIDPNRSQTLVHVQANSGVAATWGIHHYLKYYCQGHFSWDTISLNLPTNGSLPQARFNLTSNDKFRYYQNVCTPGYSFAFWKWDQWEAHIDWMALNGINLPLAFVGQEAIWIRVYKQFGLNDTDLDRHFAGPAFLPWGRMGNLNGWGGPLPLGWHIFTVDLQHKILARMRGLGMIPVLPAFAGHVPKALIDLHPNVSFSVQSWNGFNQTYLLDPTEPLFGTIGAKFIEEYTQEFGSDHIYNCDTFNEMDPQTNDTQYIRNVGRAIYAGMSSQDPKAVWLMQGWLFLSDFWQDPQIEALLTANPLGSMIILDLDSTFREQYTRTRFYYNQPFIFNDLNNFGGNLGLFGRLGTINQRVFEARSASKGRMIGTGLTPEGLSDSYLTAEFMNEMSWRPYPVEDVMAWVANYSRRRYGGQDNPMAQRAWQSLVPRVFNASVEFFNRKLVITSMPSLVLKNYTWYPSSDLVRAWDNLIGAAGKLNHSEGYRFDLVDWTRQIFVDLAPNLYAEILDSFHSDRPLFLHEQRLVFLELLNDLDRVLGTSSHFMLGPWLESAKAVIPNGTDSQKALFEFNARNQITLWGPNGQILDYAAKQWAGLVSNYYAPRWDLFFGMLEHSLATGTEFDPSEFGSRFLSEIGIPFTLDRKQFPSVPKEDSVEVCLEMYEKWRPRLTFDHIKIHPNAIPNVKY